MAIQENITQPFQENITHPFLRPFDQTVSVAALDAYRLRRLNQQLRYAAVHSRYYRDMLAGIRLPLGSPDDFLSLPFTAAEDVLHHGTDMVCAEAASIERIVTIQSAGSSGAPKRLHFTGGDLVRTVDFFHEGMRYLCGPGDDVFIFMPSASEYSIGRLLADGLLALGANPLVFGMIGDAEKAATVLRGHRPHTIVGIPAQMRKLALLEPDIRPANVLLSADYIPLSVKETISRIWDCEVFEHYGLTESGYGCAVECPAYQGQHIRHDELLLEIIDPDSGESAPAGQWGEIVLTTLRREAMPLIRYRTGDISRLITEACACGSVLPRLDRVRGRAGELTEGVNIYEMDELLLQCDELLTYRATLEGRRLTVAAEVRAPEGYGACERKLAVRWPALAIDVVPMQAQTQSTPQPAPLPADILSAARAAKRGIDRKGV